MRLLINTKFNRTFITVLAILLQTYFFLALLVFFRDYSRIFYFFSIFLSITIVIFILNKNTNPNYKIAWVIVILLVPLFGGIFYIFFGTSQLSLRQRKKMAKIDVVSKEILQKNPKTIEHLRQKNSSAYRQAKYIQDFGHFPPSENTKASYFPSGETLFESMKEELVKAENFIFMEYFIIHEGKMWNEILEILVEKTNVGIDVRIIFDDFGCLMTLPHNYHKYLESLGIKCVVFNPLVPIMSSRYNTRDHRKITVIDNNVGFTGGINLADEYINEIDRFGHWKDVGIKIQGESVWNLTVIFLTMWDYLNNTETDILGYKLLPSPLEKGENTGVVQPFSDNPLDNEPVGQNVYLNLINKAENFIYICTPYLIIDDEMSNALVNASKAGVDVKMITPHIPDKWYAQTVSRSYYPNLLEYGVKIYEYKPGFIHSKTFIVDDIYSLVGTINLDYRSLFLHFECGIWTYKSGAEAQVKQDFEETLYKCIEMDIDFFKKYPLWKRFITIVLKIFSPLM